MGYKIRNWENYQHFKNGSRNPPWIKLYKDLLNNPDWHELDGDSCKVLIMLWMVASENSGTLPDLKKVAFRLRMNEGKLHKTITGLSGWILSNDANMISSRYQDDIADKSRVDIEVDVDSSELVPSSKPNSEILFQPPIIFPTKGKTGEWALPLRLFHDIQETFKDRPVLDWIKQARLWAIANPIKQKTAKGMPSFLIGWMGRQNDRPNQNGTYQTNGKAKPTNLQEVLAKMPAGFVMPGEQKL